MPFCPNCGSEVGESKFCPECGAPQAGAPQPQVVQVVQSRKKESYNPVIGAAALCCLGPCGLFIYYHITDPIEGGLKRSLMYSLAAFLLAIVSFLLLIVALYIIYGIMLNF